MDRLHCRRNLGVRGRKQPGNLLGQRLVGREPGKAVTLRREILEATPGREAEDTERLALLLWASTHGVISLQINKPTLRWPKATALVEELMRALIRPGAARTK